MRKEKGQHAASLNKEILASDNSTHNQRLRLLAALRDGPKSTVWIRRELDILMPATRVYELRHRQSYNIETHWRYVLTEKGKSHRVAEYVLLPGAGKAEAAYEAI